MKKRNKKPLFIDLFAGCGGLSLGLEQAGFVPILVNELNKDAMDTYLLNRSDYPWLKKNKYYDVKELIKDTKAAPKKLSPLFKDMEKEFNISFENGDLDLLVGGPPCQGYSGIGHRRSYGVDRERIPANTLYQDMAQLIIRFKPKIFLFENVKGLTWAKWTKDGEKGEIWRDIQETFRGNREKFSFLKNYQVEPALIHARDYGVPQNRPRVFIVGVRKDHLESVKENINSPVANGFLPDPFFSEPPPNIIDILGDLVDAKYKPGSGGKTEFYPKSFQSDWQKKLRTKKNGKIFKKGDQLSEQDHSKNSEKVWKRWEYVLEKDGIIPEDDNDPRMYTTKKFSQRLLPKKWGNSKPNITVCGQPEDYIHFSQPRSITVREWARLQTFPDWYEFSGARTTGGIRRAGNPREGNFDREVPKYTQIGNAVPVHLAEEFGKYFRTVFLKN